MADSLVHSLSIHTTATPTYFSLWSHQYYDRNHFHFEYRVKNKCALIRFATKFYIICVTIQKQSFRCIVYNWQSFLYSQYSLYTSTSSVATFFTSAYKGHCFGICSSEQTFNKLNTYNKNNFVKHLIRSCASGTKIKTFFKRLASNWKKKKNKHEVIFGIGCFDGLCHANGISYWFDRREA